MPRPSEPPIVLVKWYELTKWLPARIESFPKSQRFVFGQRPADRTLGVRGILIANSRPTRACSRRQTAGFNRSMVQSGVIRSCSRR